MSSSTKASIARAGAIAQAWSALGDGVAPLSNGSGRPLARTVKLILDPLVIRPVLNPHLAGVSLTPDAAAELVARIEENAETLAATAAWFLVLKSARRALRITEGNPQEKYFQRCFELAHTHGAPDAATAEHIATEAVQEIAQTSGESVMAGIRAAVQDPLEADRLHGDLVAAWRARRPADAESRHEEAAPLITAALDACGTDAPPRLEELIDLRAGSAAASALDQPDAARILGLTVQERPQRPELGATASKRALPLPFDRSVFERLFAALSGSATVDLDADTALADEIARTAQPWELADEQSRVIMMLGAEAGHALESTDLLRPTSAHRLLRGRWEREAYVRRVRRLPAGRSGVPEAIREDVHAVRQGYLRRLWVRLHGRELRALPTPDLWDTLDGVLRSVVMDQRHRLKIAIGRSAEGAA